MNRPKSAFEEYAATLMDDSFRRIARSILGLSNPPLPPRELLEYEMFECLKDYVESNQDIHGRREYKKGDINGVLKSTVDSGNMGYVLTPGKWKKLNKVSYK